MTNVHPLFPGAAAPPDPPRDKIISEAEVVVYRPMLSRSLLLAARKAALSRGCPVYFLVR